MGGLRKSGRLGRWRAASLRAEEDIVSKCNVYQPLEKATNHQNKKYHQNNEGGNPTEGAISICRAHGNYLLINYTFVWFVRFFYLLMLEVLHKKDD